MNTKIFYIVQGLDSSSTVYENYMESECLIEAEEFRNLLLAKDKIEAVKLLKVEELDKTVLVESKFV